MHPADDNAACPSPAPADTAAEGLLAAGVVHDVNQMLAVIVGRAELLLRRAPGHRADLEAILLAARDATGMLGRLGRGADGTAGASGKPVAPVAAVVGDACRLVLPPDGRWRQAPDDAGGWELALEAPPSAAMAVPSSVLREVLVNLLLNALGAMPGGGRLTVAADIHGDLCRLHVVDDGPGLPVADVESVFTAGFSTSGRAGRGIGLAACRQLLAAHGASLTAANGDGRGAVFTITAPAVTVAAATAAEGAGPAERGAAGALRNLAVIVVDDEPAVREMLTDVLGEFGCRVTCHRDAAGALAADVPGDAAVALIDRRLPGLDGVELAARLRERRPSLVVVVMSGWDRDELSPPSAVVDFTVRKPLSMSSLQDLLAQAAVLHEARRSGDPTTPGGT